MEETSLEDFLDGSDHERGRDCEDSSGSDSEGVSGSSRDGTSGGESEGSSGTTTEGDRPAGRGAEDDAVRRCSVADESAVDVESGTPGASAVTPAAATFEWTPEGTDCGSCGETVERRWRDGDRFVCTACKTW